MAVAEPEFTLGIEEEYFHGDRATRDVVDDRRMRVSAPRNS